MMPGYFIEIVKAANARAISQSGIKDSLIVWVVADESWPGTSILIGRVAGFYQCFDVSCPCIACRG